MPKEKERDKTENIVQEEKYHIEDFISNAKALGYRKEVVIGALFDFKEKEISKAEFEKLIDSFLKKKIVEEVE